MSEFIQKVSLDGSASISGTVTVDDPPQTTGQDTGQTTVGTTAVEVITSSQTANVGYLLKSLSTNTGIIYVGFADTVTSSNGFELASANDGIFLPLKSCSVWCISDTASQSVSHIVV
jgi:hypothetical protein